MNTIQDLFKKENALPTLVSFLIPVIQLLAVIIVDVSNTLHLKDLFVKPELLPVSNLFAIAAISVLIGLYWYWKENYNLVGHKMGQRPVVFPQRKIFLFLTYGIISVITSSLALITFFILGKSNNGKLIEYNEIIGVFQLIFYFILIISTGISAYMGLVEYSKKQRDFKPEQYLGNLLLSMQNYGTIEKPRIRIKQQSPLTNESFDMLINLEINGEEKYLITNYTGQEILKELSSAEYRDAYQRVESSSSSSASISPSSSFSPSPSLPPE